MAVGRNALCWQLCAPAETRQSAPILMKNSNVGATHTGAFREWKEDFEGIQKGRRTALQEDMYRIEETGDVGGVGGGKQTGR